MGERLPSERDLAVRFDANRGAVREAMKKLEQIGLADVQPGGARVKSTDDASLDIFGHLLAQNETSSAELMDQILVVVTNLITLAAEQAVVHASSEQLALIRSHATLLFEADLGREEHMAARIELMQSIMDACGNLPLRLIARTLLDQVKSAFDTLNNYSVIDSDAYRQFAVTLEQALTQRNAKKVRSAFIGISNLNREAMKRAHEMAQLDLSQGAISQ